MAEKKEKTAVTEVRAYARGIHMSPRKVRLVFNMLKGLPVSRALTQLQFVTKRAALPVRKLVESAIANARHNHEIEAERLFVKTVSVDGGQVFKRFQPRAQGRAFPIRRQTSHLNLTLGVSDKPLVPKSARIAPKAVKAHMAHGEEKPEAARTAAGQTGKPEAPRRFWRSWMRRKSGAPSQVPPKADPKGRHYTSFDRRGGE